MSGRVRRWLRTVPVGRVQPGEMLLRAMEPPAASALSPARVLVQRLLTERLRDAQAGRRVLVSAGRLIDESMLPPVETAPIGEGSGEDEWLIVGDALAAEHDPAATLRTILKQAMTPNIRHILVFLPGTALLPDDTPPMPRRWLYSRASAERLAAAVFVGMRTGIETPGNALVASAEVLGIPADRLWPDELEFRDPQYPMIVAITAHVPPP